MEHILELAGWLIRGAAEGVDAANVEARQTAVPRL